MKLKWILSLSAFAYSQASYSFICELGTCTQQCTDPDSAIGEQPLPASPDINNGNYVDCIHACIDLKQQLQCSDGTEVPWIHGVGDNLDNPNLATVPIFQKGTFKAYVEPSFTPLDRELIKEALEIAVEQLGVLFLNDPINSEFAKCTAPLNYERFQAADNWGVNFWNVNTYGYGALWKEPRVNTQPYIPGFPGIKYELRIVKLWERGTLGLARVGDASVSRPVIALNWNYLKGYRNNPATGTIERWNPNAQAGQWASTIVHEIMHTEGFTHPIVTVDDLKYPVKRKEYENNFMVYFSNCVSRAAMPDSFDPNSKLFMLE